MSGHRLRGLHQGFVDRYKFPLTDRDKDDARHWVRHRYGERLVYPTIEGDYTTVEKNNDEAVFELVSKSTAVDPLLDDATFEEKRARFTAVYDSVNKQLEEQFLSRLVDRKLSFEVYNTIARLWRGPSSNGFGGYEDNVQFNHPEELFLQRYENKLPFVTDGDRQEASAWWQTNGSFRAQEPVVALINNVLLPVSILAPTDLVEWCKLVGAVSDPSTIRHLYTIVVGFNDRSNDKLKVWTEKRLPWSHCREMFHFLLHFDRCTLAIDLWKNNTNEFVPRYDPFWSWMPWVTDRWGKYNGDEAWNAVLDQWDVLHPTPSWPQFQRALFSFKHVPLKTYEQRESWLHNKQEELYPDLCSARRYALGLGESDRSMIRLWSCDSGQYCFNQATAEGHELLRRMCVIISAAPLSRSELYVYRAQSSGHTTIAAHPRLASAFLPTSLNPIAIRHFANGSRNLFKLRVNLGTPLLFLDDVSMHAGRQSESELLLPVPEHWQNLVIHAQQPQWEKELKLIDYNLIQVQASGANVVSSVCLVPQASLHKNLKRSREPAVQDQKQMTRTTRKKRE